MSQVLDSSSQGSDKTSLLQVQGLKAYFSSQSGLFNRKSYLIKAVDNVSFNVKESEFVSIVGESGSGKTTVARCIMGLTSPSSGSIFFNGDDVTNLKGAARHEFWRKVQMIYQDPFESLNPRRDVLSTISNPMKNLAGERNRNVIEEAAIKLLKEVGLNPDKVLKRLPHQLSGGEKQRVNIARALASNPQLLIADEPITMLDAAQRYNVISLLMQLRTKRKLSVLMITHDMASARMSSDRIMVMYVGKLVETGPSHDIFANPHHPYTELILSSTPGLQAQVQLGEVSSVSLEESLEVTEGCVFRPRCKYATAICATTEPDLLEKTPSHMAACHNAINVMREPTTSRRSS